MPIAEVLTHKNDWKLTVTLDYDLIFKDEFEPKAQGLYKKDGKDYPEPFVTWEIRVNNHEELRKYVRRHNCHKPINYDGEENAPIHIHQVDDYQIICS